MAFTLFSLLVFSAVGVLAEQHVIRFQNNCGRGTPTLIKGGDILSTGQDYVSNGPLSSAIAYLQTGECLFNGEHCQLVELNMNNPSCPGCGSFADLSLIPSHAFNVAASFAFFGGTNSSCDGLGAVCSDANCDTAYHKSDDNQVVKGCQADNVGLLITFCPSKATAFTNAVPGSLSGGSAPLPISAAPSSSKVSPTTSAIASIVSSTAVSVALTSSIKAAPSSTVNSVHGSPAASSSAAAHSQAGSSSVPAAPTASPVHPSSVAAPPAAPATATVTVTVTVGGCSSAPTAVPAGANDNAPAASPSSPQANVSTNDNSNNDNATQPPSPAEDNNSAPPTTSPSSTSIGADAPTAVPANIGLESPTSTVAPSNKTCMRKRSYSGALSHARSRARARAFDGYSHL